MWDLTGRKPKWFENFRSSKMLSKDQREYLNAFRTEEEFGDFLKYVDYESCLTINFMSIPQGAVLAMRHEKELLDGLKEGDNAVQP